MAEVTRPIRASTGTVLRIAQTIRVADALGSAPLPGTLRWIAARVLRSRLDHGVFALLMALGCAVTGSEPMRSLTLARPLARRRHPGWAAGTPGSGRPAATLLITLRVRAQAPGSEVSVAVGVGGARRVAGVLAVAALRAARPLAAWCLSVWLTSLEARISELEASRASRAPAGRS
jgi:hypothetical protein